MTGPNAEEDGSSTPGEPFFFPYPYQEKITRSSQQTHVVGHEGDRDIALIKLYSNRTNRSPYRHLTLPVHMGSKG